MAKKRVKFGRAAEIALGGGAAVHCRAPAKRELELRGCRRGSQAQTVGWSSLMNPWEMPIATWLCKKHSCNQARKPNSGQVCTAQSVIDELCCCS